MRKIKVLLVGCGAMGGALRQGWQQQSDIEITVIDPHLVCEGCAVFRALHALPQDYQPDIILFAIKPQIAAQILADYTRFCRPDILFISIMAGVSVATMKRYLGQNSILIRTMPNLPALVGKGITGLYCSDPLDMLKRQQVTNLFASVGAAVWVEAEDQLDIVTAISGSGPAYFFRLVEALIKSGEGLGLSKEVSEQLAQQTLVGAGAMLEKMKESAGSLRAKVTSPGGTTSAALGVFDQEDALDHLAAKAIMAAVKRSKELAL